MTDTPAAPIVAPVDVTPTIPVTVNQEQLVPTSIQAARAEWIGHGLPADQFDAAVKADGYDVMPAKASDVAQEAAPVTEAPPTADAYRPNLGGLTQSLPIERLAAVNAELGALAAGLKMPVEIGQPFLERIAEVGPMLKAMTDAEREHWRTENNITGAKSAGSEEAWKTKVEKAKALVGAVDTDLAKNLAKSLALGEVMLVNMLNNFADLQVAEGRK